MRSAGAALVGVALVLSSCARTPPSPEDEIRALLTRAETAVRERDAAAVKAMIADDYRDDEGRDKRALTAVVAYEFLREGSLHLATRLRTTSFPQRDVAKANVIAAMGRTAIDLKSLPSIDADAYIFDLELRRSDDGWQVARAEWHKATMEDL